MDESGDLRLERDIAELREMMEIEAADFVADAARLGAAWCRARVERFVFANAVHSLEMADDRFALLRKATDDMVRAVPERVQAMVGDRDDIWMHRRLAPGNTASFAYGGGLQLPERLRGAISAALGQADRLLVEHGYLEPGTPVSAGLDPSERMQSDLLRYASLQSEMAELVAQRYNQRREQDRSLGAARDEARKEAGSDEARRRWEAAGSVASPQDGPGAHGGA